MGDGNPKPVKFVFHGGSGSSIDDIKYAIEAGVIKMNIDTDTQWAFWDGIREYESKHRDYLQGMCSKCWCNSSSDYKLQVYSSLY